MRNNKKMIYDLFRLINGITNKSMNKNSEDNTVFTTMRLKEAYERLSKERGTPAATESTVISSFLHYQFAIGCLNYGVEISKDRRRQPKIPKKFEKNQDSQNVETFIEQNEKDLYDFEKTDEEGNILYPIQLDQKIEELIHENYERKDFRDLDERKLKLALKWKPNHIIVNGKIFMTVRNESKISLTHSFRKNKKHDIFGCFLISQTDFQRYDSNKGKFCDVACDEILEVQSEKELDNTILLKIENEN